MDLPALRALMRDQGTSITWVGTVNGSLHVRLGGERATFPVSLPNMSPVIPVLQVISNEESDKDPRNVQIVSPRQYTKLREASVMGVNIGGSCKPGGFEQYKDDRSLCSMAYDIEVDISSNEPGEFPLMDHKILSIALSCSCGYKLVNTLLASTGENNTHDVQVVFCTDSSHMVGEFLRQVREHMPLWLVGWNNFAFDNQCMLYHYPEMSDICELVRVGGSSIVAYGCVINIPGCYNVDAMAYVMRARAGRYSAMSLKVVADEVGARPKFDMPNMSYEMSLSELVTYNINDCDVTLDVWYKSGLSREIPSLALCAASPVADCARYITGTMMPLLVASVALSTRKVLNWSVSTADQDYKGGFVLEPTRGHHRHVVVCDFSSMYPTIMSCCNISPESVETEALRPGDEEGSVTWTSTHIRSVLSGCVALFPYREHTLLKDILQRMVELRKRAKSENPLYANALKVCANSVYGCVGYTDSALYSPSCSATVTSLGRWCVKLAHRVFERHGLQVLYGDTDSCFVSPAETEGMTEQRCRSLVNRALRQLMAEFHDTPLRGMKMELESYHRGVILLDKKRYCKTGVNDRVYYTGVAAARRNVAGLVKDTCRAVAEAILLSSSRQECINLISHHLEAVMRHVLSGQITVRDVSSVQNRDGVKCYAYTSASGKEVRRQLWESHLGARDVMRSEILKKVREECNRLTVPCGLGDTMKVTLASTLFTL